MRLGQAVTASGAISAADGSGTVVSFTSESPSGVEDANFPEAVAIGGVEYSRTFYPNEAGEWSLIASWPGDVVYRGASSATATFTVTKTQPSLTVALNASSAPMYFDALQATVTITAPVPDTAAFENLLVGKPINVYMRMPDGTPAGPVVGMIEVSELKQAKILSRGGALKLVWGWGERGDLKDTSKPSERLGGAPRTLVKAGNRLNQTKSLSRGGTLKLVWGWGKRGDFEDTSKPSEWLEGATRSLVKAGSRLNQTKSLSRGGTLKLVWGCGERGDLKDTFKPLEWLGGATRIKITAEDGCATSGKAAAGGGCAALATFTAADFADAGVAFDMAGTWQFMAEFEEDDNFLRATSTGYDDVNSVRLTIKDRAGYAVIVLGKLDEDAEGHAEHAKTADYVYRAFRARGFAVDDGLQDLTTYYWRVVPVDQYGAEPATNDVRHFATDFTGAEIPGCVTGVVTDADTGDPIPDVNVVLSTLPSLCTTTDPTGAYLLAGLSGGAYNLTVSVTGYQSQQHLITVTAAEVTETDFALAATTSGEGEGESEGEGEGATSPGPVCGGLNGKSTGNGLDGNALAMAVILLALVGAGKRRVLAHQGGGPGCWR